jgi:hypothetical protein
MSRTDTSVRTVILAGVAAMVAAAPARGRLYDALAVVEPAQEGANDDLVHRSMIDTTVGGETKGPLSHLRLPISTVEAGGAERWLATFAAGGPAEVAIVGDGGNDLDVYVSDRNVNEICKSEGPGADEYCSFDPAWGPFYFEVFNRGITDTYQLWTNSASPTFRLCRPRQRITAPGRCISLIP